MKFLVLSVLFGLSMAEPTQHEYCHVHYEHTNGGSGAFKHIYGQDWYTYKAGQRFIVHPGASVDYHSERNTFVIMPGGRYDCKSGVEARGVIKPNPLNLDSPVGIQMRINGGMIYVMKGGYLDTACFDMWIGQPGPQKMVLFYEDENDIDWPAEGREASGWGDGITDQVENGIYDSVSGSHKVKVNNGVIPCPQGIEIVDYEARVKPTCELACATGWQNGDCSTCEQCLPWEDPDNLCSSCLLTCVNGQKVSEECFPGMCQCDAGWDGPNCDKPMCEFDVTSRNREVTISEQGAVATGSSISIEVFDGGSLVQHEYDSSVVIHAGGRYECVSDTHPNYISNTNIYVMAGGYLDPTCVKLFEVVNVRIMYENGADIAWPADREAAGMSDGVTFTYGNAKGGVVPCANGIQLINSAAPTDPPTVDPTSAPTDSPTGSPPIDTATALAAYGSGSFVGVDGDDVYHCSDAHDGCLVNSRTTRSQWTRVTEVPYQADDSMQPFDSFTATTSDGAWATEPGAITFRNEVDQYAQKFPASCDCQSGGKD